MYVQHFPTPWGPWFRPECSMSYLCNTYCIVYNNKEQNQNASNFIDGWTVTEPQFSMLVTFSLPLVIFCSRSRKGSNGNRALLVYKSWSQPFVHPAQWGESGNFLLLAVLGQISSVSPASILLGLWSHIALLWHWFAINHKPAANFGFHFGFGSSSRLCFSLEKSYCSPCSVVL